MVDSKVVLWGQNLAYTFYCLAIISVVFWFALKIKQPAGNKPAGNKLFYSFFTMLVVLGVSLHLITYNTIPWVPIDLNRDAVKPDKVFNISIDKHKFSVPSKSMEIKTGEKVLFDVTSSDLTYGFGVFRQDNSMVFQMQVIPGHRNDIIWQFTQPGIYTIRSTEYSGPKGVSMVEKDVVKVTNQ